MRATSHWLESHARFRGEAEALFDVGTGNRWTYAELWRDAQLWAARLAAEGVGRGDRVGVLAYNRGETFALLFAAAELGAVLYPMNWRLSPAELTWQLAHCRPSVLLTDAAHAAKLDHSSLSLEQGPGTNHPAYHRASPEQDDPWVLMYTSGSTGKPKGALLTHRQMLFNAVNTNLACDLSPADTTLTFTPLFHTGGLNCLSSPLLHRGGRIVLTQGFEPAEALRLIEEEGITLLMGVPTIYQMLADHPSFESTQLTTVRDALCGGAPLPLPLLERYLARNIPLRQGFGMTEVGPNCFSLPPARVRDKQGSVGLPIHHVQARLVRADGSDCGIDEPGELLLSGPVVCGGYFEDEAATEASIVDGWMHTGDILTRDADGFYYVSGRKKEMFISGGERRLPRRDRGGALRLSRRRACRRRRGRRCAMGARWAARSWNPPPVPTSRRAR